MKKKLLLGLLPVLMSLSACGGVGPKEEAKEDEIFVADTLAHDEEFARGETTNLSKVHRNLDPVDPTVAMPIAVQKSGTYDVEIKGVSTECVSVRFVAAVKTADASKRIEWVRRIYDNNGAIVSQATEPLQSTHPYTTIHDGAGTLNIEDFKGGAYHHFITYTVRKIPTTYLNYFITATLSVDMVETKAVGTNINIDKQVSFYPDQEGYFLSGVVNGVNSNIPADEVTSSGDKARFTQHFKKDDLFLVGYNHTDATPANSKFYIYNADDLDGEAENFEDDGHGKIKADITHTFALYLNSSNQIWPGIAPDLYIDEELTSYINTRSTGTNKIECSLNLAVGATVEFKINGTNLHFHHYDGSDHDDGATYVVAAGGAGLYNFYLASDDNIYVSAPVSFSATLTGIDTNNYALYVCGDFSSWKPIDNYKLTLTDPENGVWSGTFALPGGDNQEYKFAVSEKTSPLGLRYESIGSNRKISSSRNPQTVSAGSISLEDLHYKVKVNLTFAEGTVSLSYVGMKVKIGEGNYSYWGNFTGSGNSWNYTCDTNSSATYQFFIEAYGDSLAGGTSSNAQIWSNAGTQAGFSVSVNGSTRYMEVNITVSSAVTAKIDYTGSATSNGGGTIS